MRIRITILMIALAISGVHCSMPDDVKETKETSMQIKDQSQKIADGEVKIQNQSKRIADKEEDIKYSGRKQDTTNDYLDYYDKMLTAKNDGDQQSKAVAWLSSFPFQQWNGLYDDTIERETRFENEDVQSFFAKMISLINQNYSIEFDGWFGLPSDRWKAIAAVGGNLDVIDSTQAIAAAQTKVTPESFYSLIIKGLAYKDQSNRDGTSVPIYAHWVLVFEPEAEYLLQMRHNALLARTLQMMTNMDTSLENMIMANWTGAPIFISSTDESNAEKIKECINWLNLALETQSALTDQFHQQLKFNKKLYGILEMSLPRVKLPTIATTENKAFFDQAHKLNDVMSQMLKTYQSSSQYQADLAREKAQSMGIANIYGGGL